MKIMPITMCTALGNVMASPQSYENDLSRWSKPKAASVAAHAIQQLAKAFEADKATHESNLPAIENNLAIVERITSLMDDIGMPKRWSERDSRSRSRYPRTISHDAGYLTDLRREVKVDDGWTYRQQQHAQLLERYLAYEAQAAEADARSAAAAERERQAEVERRKADVELAAILLRYELPIESSWADVLEALRSRNQRLDLAVAMQQTRCDWSEGPWRVRSAVDRFTMETDDDKAIINDVIDGLTDFEDGRVFRDCIWNYDALFGSVEDQQLAADVQRALGNAT